MDVKHLTQHPVKQLELEQAHKIKVSLPLKVTTYE